MEVGSVVVPVLFPPLPLQTEVKELKGITASNICSIPTELLVSVVKSWFVLWHHYIRPAEELHHPHLEEERWSLGL